MKYILLIYHDEKQFSEMGEGEAQDMYAEYAKLRERLTAAGQYLGGSRLQLTQTARSVQIRKGKELITDGPFAETHEQLGGYFLVDVKNAADAIAIAKQIPSARVGTIEVRALAERAIEANA